MKHQGLEAIIPIPVFKKSKVEKFRLPDHILLEKITDVLNPLPAGYDENAFILRNLGEDSDYVVNATIRYYIEKFKTPKTRMDVLREVKKDVGSKSREIGLSCNRFFNFLCKTKILVLEKSIGKETGTSSFFKPGQRLNNFKITRVIAENQYTDVYEAINDDGENFVIKFLNPRKAADPKRFLKEHRSMAREFKMLLKASHIPAVNKVYSFDEVSEAGPFLVLEFIHGVCLSDLADETAGHAAFPALLFISRLVTAFAQLHASNIIHGDIHCSNILIAAQYEVRIIDFGLSKSAEAAGNEVVRSGGAYFYMPPERIAVRSFEKFTAEATMQSDVYQMGLIMYRLLYNCLPFDGFTWEELAKNIIESEPSFPAHSFQAMVVPQQVTDVLKKCLHKDPLKRYANATLIPFLYSQEPDCLQFHLEKTFHAN